jgi:hypothetical protein
MNKTKMLYGWLITLCVLCGVAVAVPALVFIGVVGLILLFGKVIWGAGRAAKRTLR